MELGLGFLVGLLAGTVIVVIVSVIISASRKAVGKAPAPDGAAAKGSTRQFQPPPAAAVSVPAVPARHKTAAFQRAPEASQTGIHEMIVEEVESRDTRLNQNIQEVRELLLQLAEVIGSTGDASGRAAKAFTSAKSAIGSVDLATSGDLSEARGILVREIDRVLKSNATLHNELDKANQGIAEQRKQIEELRVQARIDGLTRIPNRAAFDERLCEYLGLLERANLAFTLLLLDIDHFKRINDVHGHVNGDRILRGVAAKISDSIRTNDFAARYGGEEFAVIFPGTGLAEAMLVAERVRVDIAKTNFRLDNLTIRITVSGGLAECTKGLECEGLVDTADKALYQAKSEGRNRLVAGKCEEKP